MKYAYRRKARSLSLPVLTNVRKFPSKCDPEQTNKFSANFAATFACFAVKKTFNRKNRKVLRKGCKGLFLFDPAGFALFVDVIQSLKATDNIAWG